jgi:glycosyltransferase involved in cell wall biosynthesis
MVLVSVILPCRNEEKTIGRCIEQILDTFKDNKIKGEIIVSDSSTDSSSAIIKQYKKSHNVIHIRHNKKGYGIACMEAVKKAKGFYLLIGDSDATYEFSQIPLFLDKLDDGYDLVIGSRMKGSIKKGAMPFMHRYIGNPVLSGILNLFFHTKISDTHSGFRAIKKEALDKLDLKTTGMEFASEMIIKAAKNNLRITEVPIDYYSRIGESKLKSFSDGWRHLRFMLMFSPTYLFFVPGLVLFFSGIAVMIAMLYGTLVIGGKDAGLYFSLVGALLSVIGYQIISLGLFSRIYVIHTGFEKDDKLINIIAEHIPLERGIILSLFLVITGILSFYILINSFKDNYRILFFSLLVMIIGIQTAFSVFFLSMMVIEKKN